MQLAWSAATLSVAFAALGLLATALFRLDGKIDALGARLDAKIDSKIDSLAARMDARFDRVDDRLSAVEISVARHLQMPPG